MREDVTVLPVFLPNRGCPQRCVYCDQFVAAGTAPTWLTPVTLPNWVEACCAQTCVDPQATGQRRELAFFGATFTGLPVEEQLEWLEAGRGLVQRGMVHGIRISTRPDHIDVDSIGRLKSLGVATVELGIQSLSTPILQLSRRNYDEATVEQAFAILQRAGMKVVGQLMPFLPGAMEEDDIYSVSRLCRWKPSGLRLFPTLVLQNTLLAEWYHQGSYLPPGLGEAARRCGELIRIALVAGVPILRVGLQDSESLRIHLVAGPHHPAFGEMAWAVVAATLLARETEKLRLENGALPRYLVTSRAASLLRGHAAFGRRHLESLVGRTVELQCVSIPFPGCLESVPAAALIPADEELRSTLGPLQVLGDSNRLLLRFSP